MGCVFRVPKKGKVENPFEKKDLPPSKGVCHQKGLCVFQKKNLPSKRGKVFFVGGRGKVPM